MKREREERTYRFYVSECLRIISENTARMSGGSYITLRLVDIIDGNGKGQDNRSGEEIAADIMERAGIKVVGDNVG